MADARSERADIEAVVTQLLAASLATDANAIFIVENGDEQVVTWRSDPGLSRFFGSPPTLNQYLDVIAARNYSVLLIDGAALQLSYTFAAGELTKHRLCYIPNPLARIQATHSDLNVDDLLDLLSSDDLRDALVLESAVRFEYDATAASEAHPAAHIHFTRDCCRLPMSRPITVRQFIHFVMRHFYPRWYSEHSFLREVPRTLPDANVLYREYLFAMNISTDYRG